VSWLPSRRCWWRRPGARVAWELLHPMLGALVVIAVLVGIIAFVFNRRRWW
jgi:hypothetical protein